MKRCRALQSILATALAALSPALLSGCNQDAGPNRAPTAQDMKADASKMTPDQQKMMQEGMKRDAERMKGATSPSPK